MNINDILNIDENKSNLNELKIKINNLVPFIGAGISMAYGYKGWEDFLKDILNKLHIYGTSFQNIDFLIYQKKFFEAAELIDNELNRGLNDVIRKTFNKNTLFDKDIQNGILPLVSKLFKNLIVTTNYDYLIEEVYKKNNINVLPLKLSPFVINNFIKSRNNDCGLLKLHGDIEDFNSLIFTKTQYEKYYGGIDKIDDNKEIPKILGVLWSTRVLLFLGCSLENDVTVKKMKELAYDDENNYHYAILPLPEYEQQREKKVIQLLQLKIRPIWYPNGNHEYIQIILQELVSKSLLLSIPIIKSINELDIFDEQEVNKYLNIYEDELKKNKDNSEVNFSMGICYLKLKRYVEALFLFEKVLNFNHNAFYYSAICILKGKKAFLTSRDEINKIEDYIIAAIKIENKAIYHYFRAYIKYDYFYRKSYNTTPTYEDCLETTWSMGISQREIEYLHSILGVPRPDYV